MSETTVKAVIARSKGAPVETVDIVVPEPGANVEISLLGMLGFEESLRLLEKSFAQFQADG